MKFKSKKLYTIFGSGPGKKYPTIRLPVELSELIGRSYQVEVEGNTIRFRPMILTEDTK